MRENRQSGSAGGEAGTTGLPYPGSNATFAPFLAPGNQELVLKKQPNVQFCKISPIFLVSTSKTPLLTLARLLQPATRPKKTAKRSIL
jgi:hypothetical protein